MEPGNCLLKRAPLPDVNVDPDVLEPASETGVFVNTLTSNVLAVIVCFIASLFFLLPLLVKVYGTFFSLSLIGLVDHALSGEAVYSLWNSSLLLFIEASFIILTITFASTLATEIFGVDPQNIGIMDIWKKGWSGLFPARKRKGMAVFGENKRALLTFAIAVSALLLLGMWFEVFG